MSATDLVPFPSDPESIEQYGDPAQFVALACERAKTWLASALDHGGIEDIVELKSQAEAIRIYSAQKQLGHDAEEAAAEVVRRAERCIGLAIRKGQEAGEIASRKDNGLRTGGNQHGPFGGQERDAMLPTAKPTDFVDGHELSNGIYPVTDDVTDEQFEEAIAEAKAEGNLSRANVVRKVKGEPTRSPEKRWARVADLAAENYSSRQIAKRVGMSEEHIRAECRKRGIAIPADAVVAGTRRIDPNVVMENTIQMAADLFDVEKNIDLADLDGDHLDGWIRSLSEIRTSLTTLINKLKKERTQ